MSEEIRQLVEAIGADANKEALRRLVSEASADELAFAPAPGEWSVVQVLRHLGDIEAIRQIRLDRMLEKDMAQLPNSDMPLPAGDRDSNDANVLLNRYARLVRETVDRTSRMSDAEVRRRGIQGPDPRVGRNGSVESSVFEQVSRIPRHLQDHLNQARNNLSAYAARAHAPG